MRANPGGEIRPQDVVGRDRLIVRVWQVLERQSVELTAERRLGKSSIVKKMTAEPPVGIIPVFRELEAIQSPLEFVEAVFEDVEGYLTRRHKQAVKLRRLVRELGGAAMLGAKLPSFIGPDWKRLLTAAIEDLDDGLSGTIVFFWDEIPYMLQNIKRRHGEAGAREILDVLRGLRQTFRSIRMVLTGSIGLHHVLSSLTADGTISHAPMNDVHRVEVPTLDLQDATALALLLIDGERLPSPDRDATARTLAELVDGNPYHVHHVVDELARDGTVADPTAVRAVIERNVVAAADPWNLRHYDRRLQPYYGAEEALARRILDTIARSDAAIPRGRILAGEAAATAAAASASAAPTALAATAAARPADANQAARIIDLLGRLELDHYLMRAPDNSYLFRYSVVKRWWRHHRP